VKVQSFTEDPDAILEYFPWYIKIKNQWKLYDKFEARRHGQGYLVNFEDITTPEEVKKLTNGLIAIPIQDLLPLEEGEFYWTDLEGLQVLTKDGQDLGKVMEIMETGANDVLVVQGDKERLIPYLPEAVILSVDVKQGSIIVDWDPDF